MSDDSFMWFKQTWFSTMDNWDHYSTFDFSIGKLLKQTGYLVPYVTFELPNRLFDMCYMDIKYLYGHLNSLIGYLTCAIWTFSTYMDIWTA